MEEILVACIVAVVVFMTFFMLEKFINSEHERTMEERQFYQENGYEWHESGWFKK